MNERNTTAAIILGISLVLAALIGAYSFYRVHTLGNTLSVTGSATATTTADTARWTVTVSRTAFESTIASTQNAVSRDSQAVVDFFTAAGVDADKIQVNPVQADQQYSNDQNAPVKYSVHQDVTMNSDNVRLVDSLSKKIASLADKGIFLSAGQPQYMISTLPQIRISLIGKAVTDAKARAEEIAKSTGQRVGPLQSAAGGVVQVMSPNSVDVSDYGSYDTSTIDKQVMVTARAVFQVR
ncbi:MAG: hypothetical protein JWM46_163 [Candidatus Kaiserbacteria bacterium]|nr:hypothetical protein [Candidatus Kaiserbacteria bacterium]